MFERLSYLGPLLALMLASTPAPVRAKGPTSVRSGGIGNARRVARRRLLAHTLKLPKERVRKAPWLRAAPDARVFNTPFHETRAVGARLAVVQLNFKQLIKVGASERWQARQRYAIVDAKRGYRGVVPFPKHLTPAWIGLDVDDRLYVADGNHQLYRANSATDALAGRFVRLAKLSSVKSWVTAGRAIVAASAGKLLRSTDRGKTFEVLPHPKDTKAIHWVALRADGLVALITTHEGKRAMFTQRGSSPWRRTSFCPDHLMQVANTIYTRHGCGYALLARDGLTWFKGPAPSARPWASMVAPMSVARWQAGKVKSQLQAAPRAVAQHVLRVTNAAICMARGGGPIDYLGGDAGPTDTGCKLTLSPSSRCLRGSAQTGPRSSVYAMYALGHRGRDLLFIDHLRGVLRTGTLPKGCVLRRLAPLPGATMAFCSGGVTRTKIFIADKHGIWHDQGSLPSPAKQLRQVQLARDGTVVLQACDFDSKRQRAEGNGYLCSTAWVRRPVALKLGAKAWREVRQRNMLAYRPLSGGRVLAVARGDDKGRTLRLFIDDGRRRRALGPRIQLDDAGNLVNLHIRGRQLLFERSDGTTLILLRKGKLALWPELP